MDKTMRNVVIAVIVCIVVAGAACVGVMSGGCSALRAALPELSNPFASAQTGALNAIIDASGIKDRIESELHARAEAVSDATGIPIAILDAGIDSLAIQEWQATEKPAADEATETGTYAVEVEDTPLEITTYDDPSYLTVDAYGQEITFAVPESAQVYMPYLAYLEYADLASDAIKVGSDILELLQ